MGFGEELVDGIALNFGVVLSVGVLVQKPEEEHVYGSLQTAIRTEGTRECESGEECGDTSEEHPDECPIAVINLFGFHDRILSVVRGHYTERKKKRVGNPLPLVAR